MKFRPSFLTTVWVGLLLAATANAHPYASGITNQGGTISWVLNESATDVKIIFDKGAVTNDLGAAPLVGQNTFSLGSHTNFAIVVFKAGSNQLTQISSDLNFYNNIYGPRGVAVNQNAKTWNFGRIYLASANPGDAPDNRATTKGIYALNAASQDVLNLGNTAATAGMSLGTSTTYSPFKMFVGPDDSVYAGDASSSKIGGVWRLDPNLATSTNLFGLANPSTNTASKGTNFGRAVGTPNITGSLAGGNLVLTMTAWDLNLTNSSGKFASSATGYQNIYQYNIGAGPLPWKSFPTIITNPIGLGTVNGVTMDAEVAPDGKYFITAARSSASDGTTNVCVLNSTGTVVLWDSRTQSKNYFGDAVNDHLWIQNYSISVSPDDQYVLIQGAANNNFLIMALTNGVPNIATLTTNTTVSANGGSTCYAATWDAADNIYVTSGGSDTLRIFSPGLTTTCVTSNDLTCTNGSFQMTATSAAVAAIQTPPASQTVQCSSNASFSVAASGPAIEYQWYLGGAPIGGATNAMLNLGTVSLAQSGQSYHVVVSNTSNAVTSQTATLTVVDTVPPVVALNGSKTMALLQGSGFSDPGATAIDSCDGVLPVTAEGSVNVNVAGTYILSYVATDSSGNSATNTRTVYVQGTNGAPSILQQPAGQAAQCDSTVGFTVIASGGMPLQYQWFDGATRLSDGSGVSGSATASLTLNGATLPEAGSYYVVISNSFQSVTSQVATLTLNDESTPVVTVNGSAVVTVAEGSAYTELGATAGDACVGNLPVTTSGSVNVNTPGTYIVTYSTTNSGGITASAWRTVIVTVSTTTVTASTPELIPLPVTTETRPGVFTLCPSQSYPPAPAQALMKILVDSASLQTGQYLASALFKSTGYQFQIVTSAMTNAVRNAILITTSNAVASLGTEGYELTVAPDSVVIRAPGQSGTFYGVQSLLQLLPPQIYTPHVVSGVAWTAPCIYIEDQPRFAWRGVMVDVARHFLDKQQIKQILDTLAMHKLNTFHWHLTDDNGWRIQITNYPALTTNSGWRAGIDYGINPLSSPQTNTAGQYGGYYTQADIQEVVAYAQQRHITIVPEIEMPCHCTAALAAYPQFGCGNADGLYDMDYDDINYAVDLFSPGTPGTLPFLEEVLTEVMGLFPGQYIHCGGDEVVSSGDAQWNSYTPDVTNMEALGITPNGDTSIVAYQSWFSSVIATFLQAHGRMMMGWDDFEDGGIIPNAALNSAETGSSSYAVAAAEAGRPVVMSPSSSCYINYIETTTNIEPFFIVGGAPAYTSLNTVYSFEPVPSTLPSQYDTNIIGAQCNLWSEYVPSQENFLFKLYPRESAMAELDWTPSASKNYTSFTNRLVTHEERLAAMGVNYNHESIPQVGTWGPAVSTTPTTMSWNITTNVTVAGEIDVNFFSTGGNGLGIGSVALLQNGVQVDIDTHAGFASGSGVYTLYVLHLPETKPGASYTIQAVVSSSGGTTSSGIVYLPNWD